MLHRHFAHQSVAAALAAAVSMTAAAQGFQMPSDQQIEDARRKLQQQIPAAGAQAERALERPQGLQRALPPAPAGTQNLDIERLVRQYKSAAEREAQDANEGIYVLVSLSMRRESLVKAAQDARRAGATVVIRGMPHGIGPGAWSKSLEALKPITDTGAALQVHPDLFRQYDIKVAPTVLVTTALPGCGTDETCRGPFATLVGDVSLDYALEQVADRRDRVGELARVALQRMGVR